MSEKNKRKQYTYYFKDQGKWAVLYLPVVVLQVIIFIASWIILPDIIALLIGCFYCWPWIISLFITFDGEYMMFHTGQYKMRKKQYNLRTEKFYWWYTFFAQLLYPAFLIWWGISQVTLNSNYIERQEVVLPKNENDKFLEEHHYPSNDWCVDEDDLNEVWSKRQN